VSSRNKRPIIVKQGLATWVMTYGDMMTLLLTFFVLIVSFSSIQDVKFKEAAMGLREALGVLRSPTSVLELNQPIIERRTDEESQDFLREVEEMERSLLADGQEESVTVDVSASGVTFRIAAPVLFASGAAELQEIDPELLEKLAAMIRKYPYEVQVEGHTDAVPISTPRFPSNWHLSAARAVTVAERLQALGVAPERLSAVGRGEYEPLADNATAEGRARNRRVEIYIEIDREREVGGELPGRTLEQGVSRERLDPQLRSPVTERLGALNGD
jgi:chemotaxis protein MotB